MRKNPKKSEQNVEKKKNLLMVMRLEKKHRVVSYVDEVGSSRKKRGKNKCVFKFLWKVDRSQYLMEITIVDICYVNQKPKCER